ncbi:hypothetical protein PIB30_098493 [Stylosanthes scabra]|uniref:Uncharacterized protein n=1 Tax=Stylosanthes scabra TaxID=79078 RepID=A0ABU6UW55_9FABA|nr:hypothetical protein [Stylosanthes scabra]
MIDKATSLRMGVTNGTLDKPSYDELEVNHGFNPLLVYVPMDELYFRLLGIEKYIGKAKEGIRSKRVTRGSQEVKNRAPYGRTVSSSNLTCPWERFGMHSANTRAIARSHRATTQV